MTRGALVRWLGRLEPDELAEVLRRRPDALAVPAPETLTQLATRLTARAGVEEVVSRLPLPAIQVLEALSGPGPVHLEALATRLDVAFDDPALDATLQVLLQRALVWPEQDALWSVQHALRGAPGAEPFEPVPPSPALRPVDRTEVRNAAVAAATLLLGQLPVLVDAAATRPLSRQRSGEVAAREQRRLAVALGLDDATVRLLSELALAAGLLSPDGVRLLPSNRYGDWAEQSPAQQFAKVSKAWWGTGTLRQVVLRVMHELPPDTGVSDPQSLTALVRWTAPLVPPGDLPAVLEDATRLGLCALGAISPLGRALADGRALPEGLLPAGPPADALHVRGVGSVLVSDDTALLDEVLAAAALRPLQLRRLAPTVAGSALSPADTLAALRSAGYRPARDSGAGPVRLHRSREEPAPRPAGRSSVDPGELAGRLLVPHQRTASPLEIIRQRAPQLRPDQAELLASAVQEGTPVWIRYVDAGGRPSERVIENPDLSGSTIEAWCRLRRDDRAFTLDKIVAVAPVSGR